MSHISGYSGTLTLGTAGDLEWGPTSSEVLLQSWTVTPETDTFQAHAKGDSWETTFFTGTRWSATMSFLMQGTAAAAKLDIRLEGEIAKAMSGGAAGAGAGVKFGLDGPPDRYYLGKGFIESIDIDDPLDGPVTVTATMAGDGDLTFVGSGSAP